MFEDSGFLFSLLNVNRESIQHLASTQTGLAVLVCFFAGILTSLTPCVYPMIPITINIFGRAAQHHQTKRSAFNWTTFQLSLFYVFGMCVTYSVLGVFAGLTGSLFGRWLQSPWMFGFLTLLFLTLAIGQLGLFKIALPGKWQTKLSQMGHSHNRWGIFLMGLFSGLIVSPCVGPVIAGILAFVFDTSSAFYGFIYFLSFSLGLGVLFLTIGAFSGALSLLPRSGAWMNRVNRMLAVLMLVAAAYYGQVWMGQMGFFKKTTATLTEKIPWRTDEKAALDEARNRHLPLIVDFTADWCEACHEMDRTLFQNDAIQNAMKRFVPLRLDVTSDSEEVAQLLEHYKVMSLPLILFVSPDGMALSSPRINGIVSVDEFLNALSQVQ